MSRRKQIEQIKKLQGVVSTDHTAKVTPITRRPIEHIDADQWPSMTTGELVDQRTLLNNRMNLARSMGATHMADQIYRHLRMLDEMIADRPDYEETRLV